MPDRLEMAKLAARKAGDMLLHRTQIEVSLKASHDYVTDADRASEALIRETLLSAFPEDGFYGEENGESVAHGGGRWIVDPIDGTTNFIHRLPMYTISIAYEDERGLALGVVYCPPLGELYEASRGAGARCNGRFIRVSDTEAPAEAVVGMSFAHRSEAHRRRMLELLPVLTRELNDLRRLGSAAFDLCCVACGRYDAFLELTLNLYDIAAGLVIAREAGATVTGWPGGAPCEQTGDVLATNGLLHAYFERALAPKG